MNTKPTYPVPIYGQIVGGRIHYDKNQTSAMEVSMPQIICDTIVNNGNPKWLFNLDADRWK